MGQYVRVELQSYTYVKGSAVFYGIPALALIAGAIAGHELAGRLAPGMGAETVSVISAFSLFALSFLGVKLWSRGAEKQVNYKPVITEILKNS